MRKMEIAEKAQGERKSNAPFLICWDFITLAVVVVANVDRSLGWPP